MLRIFVITDGHEQWEHLESALTWYENENQSKPYDWVFICGDQANCQNVAGKPVDAQENKKASESNQKYISKLAKCTNLPGRVLYIPGNHDSEEMFAENPPQWDSAINLHSQTIKLADGLAIIGFGGSAPIHVIEAGATEQKPIWETSSYPYGTEENFKSSLNKLWTSSQLIIGDKDQVIMLTHDGPYGKATTSYFENDGSQYKFGSPSLTALLQQNQEQILLNVHGHCHAGSMYDRIGSCHVLNPNSLVSGNFMEIVLRQADGKWKLDSVTKKFG